MKWPALIVRLLLELRAGGQRDFDRAWGQAVAELPPPERLERDQDEGESFAAFFRRMCEREWKGLVTADYAGLPALLEQDGGEARRGGGRTAVAGRMELLA